MKDFGIIVAAVVAGIALSATLGKRVAKLFTEGL